MSTCLDSDTVGIFAAANPPTLQEDVAADPVMEPSAPSMNASGLVLSVVSHEYSPQQCLSSVT